MLKEKPKKKKKKEKKKKKKAHLDQGEKGGVNEASYAWFDQILRLDFDGVTCNYESVQYNSFYYYY